MEVVELRRLSYQRAVDNTPRVLSKVWTALFVKKLGEAGDSHWEELHSLNRCFCQLFLGMLPADQRSRGRDGLYLRRYFACFAENSPSLLLMLPFSAEKASWPG